MDIRDKPIEEQPPSQGYSPVKDIGSKLLSLVTTTIGTTIQAGTCASSLPLRLATATTGLVGYVSAWAVDKVLEAPEYLFKTGVVHSTMGMINPLSKEIIGQATQNASNTREELGENIQEGASLTQKGLKAVKMTVGS